MHHQYWNDSGGSWGWIPMAILMVLATVAIVTLIMTLARRPVHAAGPASSVDAIGPQPSPADVLAGRLARGEIEPDDYRARLAAISEPGRTG